MDVDTMEQLKIDVATKVMGYEWTHMVREHETITFLARRGGANAHWDEWKPGKKGRVVHLDHIPDYPTDIAAAWEVAEEVHLFDDRYIIETDNGWGIYEFAPHYEFAKELVVDAETAPLAICMALLIVVGVADAR